MKKNEMELKAGRVVAVVASVMVISIAAVIVWVVKFGVINLM